MTTYKKLTWDSYKIQVESAVRDGNGATISTTYATKTELSTGLGNKLDTTTAASTYLTITDAASTYAPIATSLAGYGITDGVTTNTAQTISGGKTFTENITTNAPTGTVRDIVNMNTTTNVRSGMIRYDSGSTINKSTLFAFKPGDASLGNSANIQVENDGTNKYVTASYRGYNSGNVYDVVTIGSLAANPSVVHSTGNEYDLSGNKRFNGFLQTGPPGTSYSETYYGVDPNLGVYGGLRVHNGSSAVVLLLYLKANGDSLLRLYSPTKGTVADIATL